MEIPTPERGVSVREGKGWECGNARRILSNGLTLTCWLWTLLLITSAARSALDWGSAFRRSKK